MSITAIDGYIGNTIYGLPSNTTFADVFESASAFLTAYKACGLYDINNNISDTSATNLFYLLYARYGNNSIASRDLTRWKYNLWTIIYQYGPTWEKKLEIQKDIRALTSSDIAKGTKATHNHAYNPGTTPSTASLTELTAINEQNTTQYTKSPLEAFQGQWAMLENDVTGEFLDKFKRLFAMVAAPLYQLGFEVDE